MVKHATLHLTQNCNLHCNYCHVAASRAAIEQEPSGEVIDRLFAHDLESISFAGGEPFFVKERLYHILDRVPTSIRDIAITTNGTLIDDDDIYRLKDGNIRLQFSVDGNESSHNKNRGANIFQKTIANIRLAVANQIRVDVLTTVSRENMDGIPDFLAEIDSLGVENLTLLHFTPKGHGEKRAALELSRSEWLQFHCQLKRVLPEMKTRIWIQPRFIPRKALHLIESIRPIPLCNCYRMDYAYIDLLTGNVYPCGLAYNTPLCVGSLKDTSLDVLAENAKKLFKLPLSCQPCKDKSLCGGGARCYAWMYHHDLEKADPFCFDDDILPVCPFPAIYVAGPPMHTLRPTIV